MDGIRQVRLRLLIEASGRSARSASTAMGRYQMWLRRRLAGTAILTPEEEATFCTVVGAPITALDGPVWIDRDREVLEQLVNGDPPPPAPTAAHLRLIDQGLIGADLRPLVSVVPPGYQYPPIRLRPAPLERAATLPPWALTVTDWGRRSAEIAAAVGVSRQRIDQVREAAREAGML